MAFSKYAHMKIGQPYPGGKDGEVINKINELCYKNPEPHVHIITSERHICKPLLKEKK